MKATHTIPRRVHRALVAAVREAIEVFQLCERPRREDPQYGDEVRALGDRIGFGALMSSAEGAWRRRIAERGDPAGAEHTAGPCRATVDQTLRILRAAREADANHRARQKLARRTARRRRS